RRRADHLEAPGDRGAQRLHLARHGAAVDGGPDGDKHTVAIERLLQEVEGAAAGCAAGVFDGGVAADHDHRHVAVSAGGDPGGGGGGGGAGVPDPLHATRDVRAAV